MTEFYDRDGNPLNLMQWARLFEDFEGYRNLRQTRITDAATGAQYLVSTVWLGNNQAYLGGPPLIFETMVFSEGPLDQQCWRYSTEAHALAGHDAAVLVVGATLTEPVPVDVTDQSPRPPRPRKAGTLPPDETPPR